MTSNVQEQVWTWVNDGNEYFYDKNEWVRVRVEDERWNDISPSPPSERGNESIVERKSPYSITVSLLPLWGTACAQECRLRCRSPDLGLLNGGRHQVLFPCEISTDTLFDRIVNDQGYARIG